MDDGCYFIGMGLDSRMGDEDVGEVSFVKRWVIVVGECFGGG